MNATLVKKLGKYEILGELGRGGMGVVYLANDNIGRRVAIKKLNDGYASQPGMLERFYREARLGALQHENIVTVYEMDKEDGAPFIVMAYIDGEPLDQIIKSRKQLPLVDKLNIIAQVCSALNYAHLNGVIHRDIKPANVIVQASDGQAKLLDFGIAQMQEASDATALTRTGNVIGTIFYMGPERFKPGPIDGRSDIFSTGVMLYELLAGERPFGGNPETVKYQICSESYPPLSNYLSKYPPELDAILEKALAKDPDDRYAHAEDMRADLLSLSETLSAEWVAELLDDARRFAENDDWGRVTEYCRKVFAYDATNTEARRLLREADSKLQHKLREERIRQYVERAEEYVSRGEFLEAIRAYEQASRLDPKNADLKRALEVVREKQHIAEKIDRVLGEAEILRNKLDFTGALSLLDNTLPLDPRNSQLLTLKSEIQKQAQVAEQRGRLRELLTSADREIAARNITAAFKLLDEASAIDPALPEIQVRRERAEAVKKKGDERRLLDSIEIKVAQFKAVDDYDAALRDVNRGLAVLPNESRLLRLKEQIERESARFKVKRIVDAAITHAQELFETSPLEALDELRRIIPQIPGEERLIACERALQQRLDDRLKERLRKDALAKAGELIKTAQYDKAIGALESYRLEYGGDPDADGLLDFAKEQRRAALIAACRAKAESLAREDRLDEAMRLLESAVAETGDTALSQQLDEVRRLHKETAERLDRLQKRVDLFRERGELEEAVALVRDHLRTTPRVVRLQTLLTELEGELQQRRAVLEAAETARRCLDSKDFFAGWDALHNVRQAYGDSAELTRAIEEFQARRSTLAKEDVGKAIESAKAATLKKDAESAARALKAVAALVEFATAAQQTEWRRLSPSAAKTATAQRVQETGPHEIPASPKRTILVAAMAAGLVVLSVIAVIKWRVLHQPPTLAYFDASPSSINGGDSIVLRWKINNAEYVVIDEVDPTRHLPIEGSLPLKPQRTTRYHLTATARTTSAGFESVVIVDSKPLPPAPSGPLHPETGTITFEGNPSTSEVYEGRNSLGTADKRLTLPVGSHTLQYRSTGFTPLTHHIEVKAGADNKDSFTLDKLPPLPPSQGKLVIQTEPHAAISIGDQAAAPADGNGRYEVNLDPKLYHVHVTADGFHPSPDYPVQVSAGQPTTVTISLKANAAPSTIPPTGKLTVSPTPVESGQPVTLTWSLEHADSATIEGCAAGCQAIDPRAGQGTILDKPNQNTQYRLFANGSHIPIATAQVQVVVTHMPPTRAPSGPDRKLLEDAINEFERRFNAAYLDKRCSDVLRQLPPVSPRAVLGTLISRCGHISDFKASHTCSAAPSSGGSDDTANWICDERRQFKRNDGGDPSNHVFSTEFRFEKQSNGGWVVTQWTPKDAGSSSP